MPVLSGLVLGPVRSFFSCRSSCTAAVLSHSRIAPQISARLLPHIIGFFAFQPKFTPRTLYLCSVSRSRMPYPSPPSSSTTSAGLKSSMASITCPTTVMVSSPLYLLISNRSRPCRATMTVESDPLRAGSTPITMGACGSLYLGRLNASSTIRGGINCSSPVDGNSPYTSIRACGESSPYSSIIC